MRAHVSKIEENTQTSIRHQSKNVGPELTFAGLFALIPRMIEIGVAFISTIFIPSTAASATTSLARVSEGAALATYGTD